MEVATAYVRCDCRSRMLRLRGKPNEDLSNWMNKQGGCADATWKACGESSRFAFVVPENSAEAFFTEDFAFGRRFCWMKDQSHVSDPLMWPFFQIMVHKFVDKMPKMFFAEDDELVKTLGLIDRTNRSAWALRFGAAGPTFTGSIPSALRRSSNARVNVVSRSWIRCVGAEFS